MKSKFFGSSREVQTSYNKFCTLQTELFGRVARVTRSDEYILSTVSQISLAALLEHNLPVDAVACGKTQASCNHCR